jgi:thiamine pyrophosphate-dependent acetolactate synthase large subunit-like protein
MFVHQALARAISEAHVDTMFGLLGDSNLFMVNAFVEEFGGRYISAVHEASAVMMAQGYASRSGRVGVATVTQGPGLTNTATALVEAVRSSAPLVIITGDTSPSNLLNQQSLVQEPFVRATGAEYVLVESPAQAVNALRYAFGLALGRSRPVVLNCPTEYQWAELDYVQADVVPQPVPVPEPTEEQLDVAVGLIASANRPLVLAGRGVVASVARDAVLAFAKRIGAPLTTTLRARNLYSADEGSLGVMGTLSSEKGAQAIADCDCIIVFGASLNTWTTVRNTLLGDKPIVHVDSDPSHLIAHATAPVPGDAAAVAAEMTAWLDEAGIAPSNFRARVTDGLSTADQHAPPRPSRELTFAGALDAIVGALPEQRTVVFDGGRFLGEGFAQVYARDVEREVLSTSFGAVGLGMGAAIGAAAAAGDEPTLLVTGDGGFMMNGLAELHSAIRQALPLVVVICNDGSYGAEYDQYVNKGIKPDLSLFTWPSFPAVAQALGAVGVSVESLDDLPAAVAAAQTPGRSVVIDVRVDAAAVPEVPH